MKRTKQREDDSSFVGIDEMSLDKEWVNQPAKYLEYARYLANAGRALDEAKTNLEVVKAELDSDIRRNPDKYDLGKVTEGTIASTIPLQDGYQEAAMEVIDAKHNKEIYAAAVGALEHRKKALEKLVELHLSSYYANPKAPKGSEEVMQEAERRSTRRPLKKKRKRS